jgi:hypothetical protein
MGPHAIRAAIAAGILGAATAVAAADEAIPEHPALSDRFYFGAGLFLPQTSTSAQLQSKRGLGANIDFENALGMTTSKSVPVVMGRWRFGQAWRLEAEYFQFNRSGSKRIDREIQWGDTVYPVSAQLDSAFDFSDLRISAGYAFFRRPDKEVGVGLGLHVAQYDVRLSSNAIGTESSAVTAPLPVFSIYSQFALTERWAISARMDRFVLRYREFDGSVTALGLDLMYQPFRHVGFGLGTRAMVFDVSATDEAQRTLKFRQSFQGPLLFMNVSF